MVGSKGVSVANIVLLHESGASLERILDAYPSLTKEDVREALAYYAENHEEVDAERSGKLSVPFVRSKIYVLISEDGERKLREAAARNMSPMEASRYAGVHHKYVRGFWRRIGHNYLTPEQQRVIAANLDRGITTASRRARVYRRDVEYFIKLNGKTL